MGECIQRGNLGTPKQIIYNNKLHKMKSNKPFSLFIKATFLDCICFYITSCSHKKTDQKKAFEFMLDQCVKIFDTVGGEMNSKCKGIFVGRILEIKNSSITVSITSINGSYNIINSLAPFCYIESNSNIIAFPLTEEKNHFLKNFTSTMDSAFSEETRDRKLYINYNWNYSMGWTPSIGFFSIKWLTNQDKARIRYFITSPIASVPIIYRPIEKYITGKYLTIDSTDRWYPQQPEDAFKDNKKLKNFMFKNKVTLKLPK